MPLMSLTLVNQVLFNSMAFSKKISKRKKNVKFLSKFILDQLLNLMTSQLLGKETFQFLN